MVHSFRTGFAPGDGVREVKPDEGDNRQLITTIDTVRMGDCAKIYESSHFDTTQGKSVSRVFVKMRDGTTRVTDAQRLSDITFD